MAVIHDMIPPFDVYQPDSLEGALEVIDRHRDDAWILAGGLDSFDWFKDRAKRPKAVVDIGAISELTGIRDSDDVLEIGAMTSLTRVVNSKTVKERFPILSEAAATVATPQIRNQGTLGGNLAQDTRCWYYRAGWPCYRAGGNICYADTPQSMNREHCTFGGNRCVAVSPSDTAPVMVVLEAEMVVASRRSRRTIKAQDFFIGPAVDITRMTAMQPNEVLVSVRIPSKWSGANLYFEKVRDRGSWDFPLVNIAAAVKMNGDAVEDSRIACGAVAPYPYRLARAERALRGKQVTEQLAETVADAAIEGARTLQHNGFKLPLMRNLVKRALRETAA